MILVRDEAPAEAGIRETLLDTVMGPARFTKTCERLREGRMPAERLSLVAEHAATGAVVGTVRLWHVTAGPGRPALMLGPLAVDESLQGAGIGGALMREAIARASALGHAAIVLVGDAAYYQRFGFSAALTQRLWLPGAYERERFQALELVPGALDGAAGLVQPTGAVALRPDPLPLTLQDRAAA